MTIQTGLFRVVQSSKDGNWYYRHFDNSWTMEERKASLMPRSVAEVVMECRPNVELKLEFVPQLSGVDR